MYIRVVNSGDRDGSIRFYLQIMRETGRMQAAPEAYTRHRRLDVIKEDGSLDRLISLSARHSERLWVTTQFSPRTRLFVKLCGNSYEMVQNPGASFSNRPPHFLSRKKLASAF